ncbi:MAG: hypothetical protein IPL61_25865 [Myxococcales bacterium]|nr:hypothetical protein [Myxococcales bacterium]
MATETKLLFGLNTIEATTLTVPGPATAQPALIATCRDGSVITAPYDLVAKRWVIDLGTHDYLIKLALTKTEWFDGALTITASVDTNFVYFGPLPGGAEATVAWRELVAVSDGDPKDPWPPPGLDLVTLSPESFAWHDATLRYERSLLP